jgi:hypothetical protein
LEPAHGQGTALPLLAHPLARAVADMLKRPTAWERAQCLQGAGSRGGEPAASRDMAGSRLARACATSCLPAALHVPGPRGLLSPSPRLCLDSHSGSCTRGASRTTGRVLPRSRAWHALARR